MGTFPADTQVYKCAIEGLRYIVVPQYRLEPFLNYNVILRNG